MRSGRQFILFCAVTFTIIFLAGCGGHGSQPTPTGGFNAGNLNGTYAFSLSGSDANGFFAVAGSLQADGAGRITGGVEDINRGAGISTNVPITGTYSVRADGRGVAVLNSAVGNFDLAFVLVSSQHVMVTRFEASGTGSGAMDLQNPAAFSTTALAGAFAFNVSGIDAANNPLTSVGSVTLDTTGNVTAGVQDSSDNGVILTSQAITPAGSSITVGPSNGRGTATLVTTTGTLTFAFYIVDANHLKLVETDANTALAGEAFRQSGPFTNASLSGPFAFAAAGANAAVQAPLVAGGILTSNGTGAVTGGTEDINDGGATHLNLALTGNYSISGNRGTLTLTNTSGTFSFAIYPSSGGVQLMETDTGTVLSGLALQQQSGAFSTASLQGAYALNFSAVSTAGNSIPQLSSPPMAPAV